MRYGFPVGLRTNAIKQPVNQALKVTKIAEENNKILSNLIINRKEDLKEIYLEEIRKHVKNAEKLASSEKIKDGPFKDMLREAPRYIVNKMLENVGVVI